MSLSYQQTLNPVRAVRAALEDQGDTMTKYTAEDFAKAEFGRHENGRLATRSDPENGLPWDGGYEWLSDADMAADPGWRIVRDAESLTAREHQEKTWEKAHETDVIPAGAAYITKWANGDFAIVLEGEQIEARSRGPVSERRLLDPPPAPAWHNARIIEAWHDDNHQAARWARADDGTWLCLATHHHPTEAKASELHDVTVIVGADT